MAPVTRPLPVVMRRSYVEKQSFLFVAKHRFLIQQSGGFFSWAGALFCWYGPVGWVGYQLRLAWSRDGVGWGKSIQITQNP